MTHVVRRAVRAAAVLSFVPALHLAAQDSAVTVVRSARLLDVARGIILRPGIVVVQDDRIVRVGGRETPAGAATIDLGDVTLLPGLIDMHTHLTGQLDDDWVGVPVRETPADLALHGALYGERTLRAGFTTVRDVGAGGFSDVGLMHAIDAGRVLGPRIVPAGNAIGITGGHCDATGWRPGVLESDWKSGVADGVDEVVKAVRYTAKHGAKVIKVCATAGVLSFEGPVGAQQLSEQELSAIVTEARRHGLKVAAHAHGNEGIAAAVRAGVASIEHGSVISDATLALMKQRGTYLVPTAYLLTGMPLDKLPPQIRAKAESVIPRAQDTHRRAIRAGVRIAFGTDAAVYPHGQNAREFSTYVGYGMTPLQAIRTATVSAADLLGVNDRGVLAAGKLADVIAVPGNPLEDVKVLEQVRWVMKGGRVVPPRAGQQVAVVRAARMLDVTTGQIRSPAVVTIVNGRIASIGTESPAAAAMTDLGDVTLVPGFIDGHTHLTDDVDGDFTLRPARDIGPDYALRGAGNARRTLFAGFTTVRDVGGSDFADVALMRAIDRGDVDGPRMFPAGHSIGVTGGHCDQTGFAPDILVESLQEGTADGPALVMQAVREQIKYGAKVIKLCATAGVLSFEASVGAQQMSDAELRAAVDEAARHGLRVAAHAHGTEGILAAVKAGVASIEHGSMLTDEIFDEMKRRGTYLVPTTYLRDIVREDLPEPLRSKRKSIAETAKASHRRAIAAGVKMAFGTDAAVFPHGQNAREFASLVSRGMSPLEALRTATVNGADLLGVDDRGTIAPGKLADMVALPGNPLEDIRVTERPTAVIKGGVLYRLEVTSDK
ncbi:MAG TPA: amidohydrolase family protein [Gemmatimonadales bacterium]|nr:amidohydrolase family protein [Gemmatimonadales bacterium]